MIPPSAPLPIRVGRRGLVVGGGLAAATLAATDPASANRAQHVHGSHHVHGSDHLHGHGRSRWLTKSPDGMIQRRGIDFRAGGVNAFQLITNDYPSGSSHRAAGPGPRRSR